MEAFRSAHLNHFPLSSLPPESSEHHLSLMEGTAVACAAGITIRQLVGRCSESSSDAACMYILALALCLMLKEEGSVYLLEGGVKSVNSSCVPMQSVARDTVFCTSCAAVASQAD